MNETEQFLKDLGNDQNPSVDILEQPFDVDGGTGEQQQTQIEDQQTQDENLDDGDFGGSHLKPHTRRERRLIQKLNDERESSIFLAGKLQAREEARKALDEEADYIKSIERIYGTDTPEAQLATDLLKKAIIGARDDAENRAYSRYEEARQKEIEEERQATSELDDILDEIEDTYDIELNPTQERAYFSLLQKMSPKDSEGRVVSLADPHAVFEVFQEKLKSSTNKGTGNRARDLSARSMTQSGASQESTIKDDAATRFLKDNGII